YAGGCLKLDLRVGPAQPKVHGSKSCHGQAPHNVPEDEALECRYEKNDSRPSIVNRRGLHQSDRLYIRVVKAPVVFRDASGTNRQKMIGTDIEASGAC